MQHIPTISLAHHEWKLQLQHADGALLDPNWELKDPSIIRLENGHYRLYASVGTSITQTWMIGMFEAESLTAPWHFVGRANIDLEGERVCAPALVYDRQFDHRFVLDVQSECFMLPGRDCAIYRAYSSDGHTFTKDNNPLVSTAHMQQVGYDVIGVYDAGTSIVKDDDLTREVVLFSAYRRDHESPDPRLFGDIYMIHRSLNQVNSAWSSPQLVISQDHVPFHNRPFTQGAEWGVEGAKVIQLSEENYLWVFVSFLDGYHMRQRVTWATSRSLHDKPIIMGVTYPAKENQENGHSDIFVQENQVIEIRQQREGKDGKWYLVGSSYDKNQVNQYCLAAQAFSDHSGDQFFADPVSQGEPVMPFIADAAMA